MLRRLALVLLSCSACAQQSGSSRATAHEQSASHDPVIVVPEHPRADLLAPSLLASDLMNPRGVLRVDEKTLLVAEAGKGDPAEPLSARLLALSDANLDGSYAVSERRVLLDGQRSMHILEKMAMNRDEVFGLADLARGGDTVLLSAVDLDAGSTLYRIDANGATKWGAAPGNANSLAHDPVHDRWYAVQSFENTLVEVMQGGASRLVTSFPPLAQGQDAVPAALAYEPASKQLLVVMFSGQVGGDTGGSGVDFVARTGEIVRLDPQTGRFARVVAGLTTPVDVLVTARHQLLVLEFCSAFLDPMPSLPRPVDRPSHGGFKRFSGRLLQIDLHRSEVLVLAQDLDQPTHMELEPDGSVLISEGQGTPGRLIPGVAESPEPLMGRVRRWARAD